MLREEMANGHSEPLSRGISCVPLWVPVHARAVSANYSAHYTSHCFIGASEPPSVLLYSAPHLLYSYQDVEKVRQLCKTLGAHRLAPVHKRDAHYSARREPQRLTVRPREKNLSRQVRGGRVKKNTIRLQDTAGSPSRRRARTWRSFFIAPCAWLRPRWTAIMNILRGFSPRDPTQSSDWFFEGLTNRF
jgi:hypothetical protein